MAFQRELHSKSDQLEDGEEQAAGGGPDHPGDAPPRTWPCHRQTRGSARAPPGSPIGRKADLKNAEYSDITKACKSHRQAQGLSRLWRKGRA